MAALGAQRHKSGRLGTHYLCRCPGLNSSGGGICGNKKSGNGRVYIEKLAADKHFDFIWVQKMVAKISQKRRLPKKTREVLFFDQRSSCF